MIISKLVKIRPVRLAKPKQQNDLGDLATCVEILFIRSDSFCSEKKLQSNCYEWKGATTKATRSCTSDKISTS